MAAAGALDAVDVADISSSPAYTFLDGLVASGGLSQAQVALYKSKYAKLHEVVLKTYENEKNLLKKAKQLNQDLSGERGKLEKTAMRAQEDSEAIAALRAEVSKGESELAMRDERDLLLQHEAHDLQQVRHDLELEISSNLKRQAAELQPQIDALTSSVEEVRGELDRHKAALAKLSKERADSAEKAQSLRAQKTDVEAQRAQMQATLIKVRAEPEKMKKQADVVATAAAGFEAEASRLTDSLSFLDNELANQALQLYNLTYTPSMQAALANQARERLFPHTMLWLSPIPCYAYAQAQAQAQAHAYAYAYAMPGAQAQGAAGRIDAPGDGGRAYVTRSNPAHMRKVLTRTPWPIWTLHARTPLRVSQRCTTLHVATLHHAACVATLHHAACVATLHHAWGAYAYA